MRETMDLTNITHKAIANFESHIDHAQQSALHQKFSDAFFKDFDIDNPFLTVSSAISELKERVEINLNQFSLLKNNSLTIEDKSLQAINNIQKERVHAADYSHKQTTVKAKI